MSRIREAIEAYLEAGDVPKQMSRFVARNGSASVNERGAHVHR